MNRDTNKEIEKGFVITKSDEIVVISLPNGLIEVRILPKYMKRLIDDICKNNDIYTKQEMEEARLEERKRTLEEVYKHIGNIIDDCEQENYQVAFRHLLMKLEDKPSKLKYKDNGKE